MIKFSIVGLNIIKTSAIGFLNKKRIQRSDLIIIKLSEKALKE